MLAMWFVGVDPGFTSGGVAVLDADGHVVELAPLPRTEDDLVALLSELDRDATASSCAMLAVVERVNAHKGWHASGAFTFGCSLGAIRAALHALGIAREEVSPATWQRAMGCLTRGDKGVTLRCAKALFPGTRGITHRTADALLIAEYARRQRGKIG